MRISDWSSDVCSSDLPGERVQAPSFWIDDHADRIIAHGQATDQTAPHLNFFRPGMADIEAVDRRYRDFYRDLPFNAVYQSLYHTVLNRMADGCAPVLIHCSAGKDRTGLFAALTDRKSTRLHSSH